MNRIGTREEWLAARTSLLAEEKELTRRSDALARKRQALPWVAVEKDYSFESHEGTKTLADLFDGRSQLLVYHFMFGPTVDGWPDAGCPGCSYTADSLDGAVTHLPPRGVTFVAVSPRRAPRSERIRDRGRGRLPHVLVLGPRHRCPERHLAAARPHSEGARRRPRGLAAPTRRVPK